MASTESALARNKELKQMRQLLQDDESYLKSAIEVCFHQFEKQSIYI